MRRNNQIAIGWNGLPHYAAVQLAHASESTGIPFTVIATRPDTPAVGMEKVLKNEVRWIDRNKPVRWEELGLEAPKVFFHSGWRYPHFSSLAAETRSRGGKVVGMFDNSWTGSVRQLIGGIVFRILMLNRYAAVMVPGRSGSRLASYLGFNKSQVYEGMYGASPETFSCSRTGNLRPRKFLYVGRLESRKSVLEIAEAYSALHGQLGNWGLKFIGDGPLTGSLKRKARYEISSFREPDSIAREMNDARVLVLASKLDHWGVVVHEAALCGCALLLTKGVGASEDLALPGNSVVLRRSTAAEIHRGLECMARKSDAWFEEASSISRKLAGKFGPDVWTRQFQQILKQLGIATRQ